MPFEPQITQGEFDRSMEAEIAEMSFQEVCWSEGLEKLLQAAVASGLDWRKWETPLAENTCSVVDRTSGNWVKAPRAELAAAATVRGQQFSGGAK